MGVFGEQMSCSMGIPDSWGTSGVKTSLRIIAVWIKEKRK
jgi:hypothetical protein